MGSINSEEIISILKTEIENYDMVSGEQEVGSVIWVGDGIATIYGIEHAMYGEIVIFENGIRGMVQDIRRDQIGCIILGKDTEIKEGTKVTRTKKKAGVPVGNAYLGRIVNALGAPIDGKGEIPADDYRAIEQEAPGIVDRQSVNQPLETGILAIDAMFPIGRGQRELITLKKGVSVGIGFFIAFLGLQDGHIVVNNDSTLVTIVDFTGDFHTLGIGAILALIGLFIISILYIRGVKGAILIGIAATWILGMIAQAAGLYIPDAEAGFYSLYPVWGLTDFTSLGETFGQCFKADFSTVRVFDFVVIILSFLFVDMFDTLGTLIGVANKAQMLDENDKLPRIKQALLADAIATSAGAVLGTSTTTTFVESSSGVAEGARTGLASVVTGFLFLLAIFFSPIFCAIPGFATAPALIFVGFLMVTTVISIDFTDMTEAIPAYLCMLAMPLMYSISEGIAIGVISYVVINVICGKAKKITPLMYVLAVLFVCKYIFL